MNARLKHTIAVVGTLIVAAAMACTGAVSSGAASSGGAAGTQASLGDSAKMIAQNLMKFDTLDLVIFSHQQFDRFKESHAEDIIVTWPDGHETKGLARHLEDMKAMFVPTPDLTIPEHPIKIGNGHWTAVVGRMIGTFSEPMPIGNGKKMPPTGKKIDMLMTTIGHWTDAGVMDHEWLFWDNQTYMKQMGLAK